MEQTMLIAVLIAALVGLFLFDTVRLRRMQVQRDVLITGDISHHIGIDAVAQGLAVIDAGHYGIEHIFIQDMAAFLSEKLKGVKIISAPLCHPFTIV